MVFLLPTMYFYFLLPMSKNPTQLFIVLGMPRSSIYNYLIESKTCLAVFIIGGPIILPATTQIVPVVFSLAAIISLTQVISFCEGENSLLIIATCFGCKAIFPIKPNCLALLQDNFNLFVLLISKTGVSIAKILTLAAANTSNIF